MRRNLLFVVLALLMVAPAIAQDKPQPNADVQAVQAQLQQALQRIAVLERRLGPESAKAQRKLTRQNYVLACQLRGMKFDRLSLDRDGKETVICR